MFRDHATGSVHCECGGSLIVVGPIAEWGGKFRVWCVGPFGCRIADRHVHAVSGCSGYWITRTDPDRGAPLLGVIAVR